LPDIQSFKKHNDMINRSGKYSSLFALLILFAMNTYAQGPVSGKWTKEKAAQWLKKGDWKKGLQKKAHASVNPLEFAEQYNKNQATWDKAFVFLNRQDLETLAPGNYPIDGEQVYATITEADSKDLEKTRWESHRKYIDLQYVIKGKEKIGVAPVAQAKVTDPYDEAKDIAHYETAGKYYTAEPGTFFLFFPQETHRPSVKVDKNSPVKKLVIKIRVAG
jgi:YhcH/YjgK/YiaL family protein